MGEDFNIPSKDIFNMLEKLRDEIKENTQINQKTREELKKYNGIKEDISDNMQKISELTDEVENVKGDVQKIKTKDTTEEETKSNIRNKTGWIIAILASISNVIMALVAMGVI